MVCEQATKGREEGERGGLIPHSRFLFYDNPAFRASLIFLTNTVFLPNTRHFAFTQFPHYGENPDPENTFTDPVRNRRRSCKKAKGDFISFSGIPQFDGQLYRTNHVTEGFDIRLD